MLNQLLKNWLVKLKKKKPIDNLESIADTIRSYFISKDNAREMTLNLTREVIRCSAYAIRAIHREEEKEATQLIDSASASLQQLKSKLADSHNDLLFMGFVHDAQKEFAEANITFSLITGKPLPGPDALGINYAAYLNGLGEAVGELRRYVLDNIRKDNLARSEEILSIMDDIYNTLITIDFPDAITHGLRRTTDSVRGILERTRGDLTLALKQKSLEEKLDRFSNGS
jgi:translin